MSKGKTITVVIADDHAIVRKGIRALLATERDIEVRGEAADGAEAVALAVRLRPDIVLMDLVMPVLDGIEATRQVRAAVPETRVLVLTSFAADDKVMPALRAGALGYLLKDSGPEDLVNAIRLVDRGESSLHPAVTRRVLNQLSRPPERAAVPEPLTLREREVLRLLAKGCGNQDIARQLTISEATARTHVSNILNKLHVASRTQAALYALREGLVALNQED
jgi:two-component system, NarL family, response regulator LiaR